MYRISGELNDDILDIFNEECDESVIPEFLPFSGYNNDWRIIGIKFKKYFGDPRDMNFTGPIKPKDLSFEQWQQAITQMRWFIHWVSTKLFLPEKMIKNSVTTEKVLLRIAVSFLDKETGRINLPKHYLDEMFDNLIYCFWMRERAYGLYYSKVYMQLPF